MRKEYLIYNYGPAAAGDGKSAEPFNKPASVRSSSSDRHWMTASNGKRHNGSGRGNNNNKMGADQRSKRVSHNGSHHSASASTGGDSVTPSDPSAVALDEIDCLAAFHAVYHELQLIRTVRRPRDLLAESPQSKSSPSGGNKKKNFHHPPVDVQPMQTLLFLGNIHSQLEQRASYRPTSYQPALVRHDHQEVSNRFGR